MQVKDILKEFNLTEDEYKDLRYSMFEESFLVSRSLHEDNLYCWILYFDSDEGCCVIKHDSEVFAEEGFSIELIDCRYCDISYKDMKEIIEICEDFEIEAQKVLKECA